MTRPKIRHLLAGLQAGVLGGMLMLIWLMVSSSLNARSIWLTPNLYAMGFFGEDAYRNGFVAATLPGVACLLAIHGTLGAIWGLIWGEHPRPFMAIYGAVAGLVIYFAFFGFVWKYANPLITIYAPTRQLQVGHVLWGILLSRSPRYAQRIALAGDRE